MPPPIEVLHIGWACHGHGKSQGGRGFVRARIAAGDTSKQDVAQIGETPKLTTQVFWSNFVGWLVLIALA
ncbi:hypothetical protein [Devosia sp. FKR38]|uniref:hypothetical protein n=1 Tax=Devosia sp. FKR38 TaxID=2562312 RepID=UPI0010C060E0|nr:hypothetical protein [Devosia sp. FKR38]